MKIEFPCSDQLMRIPAQVVVRYASSSKHSPKVIYNYRELNFNLCDMKADVEILYEIIRFNISQIFG
jgi:hypothetical protein